MIVHGYDLNADVEAKVFERIAALGTFRNIHVISALRCVDALRLVAAAGGRKRSGAMISASEIAMRGADVLIKLWKRQGRIKQGEKRGDWAVVEAR